MHIFPPHLYLVMLVPLWWSIDWNFTKIFWYQKTEFPGYGISCMIISLTASIAESVM